MLTSMSAILCADDDVFFLYSLWKALRADGFKVLTASNGAIALEVSRKHHGPIDLLLTCIDLPRMSGLELSGIIKAERPEIKVITMSRDSRGQVQASIQELPFLQKPFTTAALRDSVGALLRPAAHCGG